MLNSASTRQKSQHGDIFTFLLKIAVCIKYTVLLCGCQGACGNRDLRRVITLHKSWSSTSRMWFSAVCDNESKTNIRGECRIHMDALFWNPYGNSNTHTFYDVLSVFWKINKGIFTNCVMCDKTLFRQILSPSCCYAALFWRSVMLNLRSRFTASLMTEFMGSRQNMGNITVCTLGLTGG